MFISKIALSRLLKLEIPQLAKGVLDIVERHDPESLLIESAFNDFNLLKPEIESLIVRYGAHPVTEQLEPFRQKRILCVSSITFQVRGLVKGYIDGTESDVRIAKEVVNRYLHNLRAHNEEIINERVDQFLQEMTTNENLISAMSTLGITRYIDDLTSAQKTLVALLTHRNASVSKRAKGVMPLSSKAIRDGLLVLFGRISAATWDNKELDYNPLIRELNEKLIRFGGLIKTREAILKKNKDASLGEGELTVPTSMMSHLRVENVNGDGFDYNQNQKKAVAPSGKHMQLPPENSEA